MANDVSLSMTIKAVNQTSSAITQVNNGLKTMQKTVQTTSTTMKTSFKQSEDAITSFKGVLEGATQAVTGFALNLARQGVQALVGFGVASVQMAAKYEQTMNMVQSLTGSTTAQMQQYSDGIKQMAVETGQATDKLGQGLYYVISAGYQGADALKVLDLSTKDAVIGMTDAQTTANALTTVLRGFSIPMNQAAAANGELMKTVKLGKMTWEDYAAAISKVASVSSQYGVSLEATNAAIATLTANGVKNAKVAATDVIHLEQLLMGNTDKITKNLKTLGIQGFDQAKFKALDFQGRILYLQGVLKNHGVTIDQIIGKSLNAAQAYTILTQHADVFKNDLAQLSNQMDNAKATEDAWTITQQGLAIKLAQLQQAFNGLMESIGTSILPILGQVVDKVRPIVTQFEDWWNHSKDVKQMLDQVKASIKSIDFVKLGNDLKTDADNTTKLWNALHPANTEMGMATTNTDALTVALQALGYTLDIVVTAAQAIWLSFSVAFNLVVNNIIDKINRLISAYDAVAAHIPGATQIPLIAYMASPLEPSLTDTGLTERGKGGDTIGAFSVQAHTSGKALPKNLGSGGGGGGGGSGGGTGTGKTKAAGNKLTPDEIAQVVKNGLAAHIKTLNASLLAHMSATQQYNYIAKEANAHHVKVEALLKGLPKDLAQWIEYTLSKTKSSKTKHVNPQAFTSTDITDIEANFQKLGITFDDTLFETLTNAQKLKYIFQQIGDNQQTLAEVMKGAHKSLIDYVEYELQQTINKMSKTKKGKNTLTIGGITGTSATAAAVSQSSSGFTVINNISNTFGAITINAGSADAKQVYNMVIKQLDKDIKRAGLYSSMTSGGHSAKK